MGRPIIKEAILDLNESNLACELYKDIINPHGWERDHWSSHHNLAYCIYISSRSEPHRGVLLQLVQDKNVYTLQFHRFMIQSEPQSLLDTQFLLEFYRRYFQEKTPYSKQGLNPWEALTEMHFKPNSLLDELLGDTRGLIMWDHQYDQLLQLIGPQWFSPPEMRVRLGFQSGRLWREYQQIKIGGRKLHEMVEERAIFGSTRAASLPGALTLWNALNGSSYN